MREIKFRAWDAEENKYWYFDKQGSERGSALVRWLETPERYVVQQYSGLKDKNGRDVYEGDIIRTDNSLVCEILWSVDEAAFRGRFVGDRFLWSVGQAKNVEVIGNIYENPELIKN